MNATVSLSEEEKRQYQERFLEEFPYATSQERTDLQTHISFTTYKKGDFFLANGSIQTAMGFVCRGLLRRYYLNEKGNHITTGFIPEEQFATDYPAFLRQQPTKYNLQCLEPSVIITLPFEIIQESYSSSKNSERHGRQIAERVLTILSDRVEGFLFLTAEERYLKFLEEHPNLSNRVSLTHLSSFLGIERQSLSRIRKRIAKK